MTRTEKNLLDENAFFRMATLRICSSLHLENGLARFLSFIQEDIPADAVSLSLYDTAKNLMRVYAFAGDATLHPKARWFYFPDHLWKALVERNREGMFRSEVVNRLIDADPLFQTCYREACGDRTNVSLIGQDLELDGERIGYFLIQSWGEGRFTEAHRYRISLLHDPLAVAMANCIQHEQVLRLQEMLQDDNRFLQRELRHVSGDTIIGADFGLRSVMQLVRQVAVTDSPVLLSGETGAGKEVIAGAIHAASDRSAGPFITVNCGAIPESLMDSELFGHEKGAFTGAAEVHRGRFERANGGTIFLDELGELPPQAQVRLLRVLQNREIERVGGQSAIAVDVRVISATHRDLGSMVQEGRFRKDLWFRLHVFPIRIPPLRDRQQDIPALVDFFMEKKARELKIPRGKTLEPGAMERLISYSWPGNVRELENVVERELILRQGGVLRFLALGDGEERTEAPSVAVPGGVLTLEAVQVAAIRKALAAAGGKVEGPAGAAELLQMHPSTLRARMRKLGIRFGRKGDGIL